MKANQILQETKHRTTQLPENKWKWLQEWKDLIFLHWEIDPSVLKKIIPNGIELDLFNNKAWISIVAFDMKNIKPRSFPSFPPISNFHEINIRTYTKNNNKQGVYFLSIEASKKTAAYLANKISKMPYRFSKMERDYNTFRSANELFKDSFEVNFKKGNIIKNKSELDVWLTERYAVHLNHKKEIFEFEVHHIEWPIKSIDINNLNIEYTRFNTLFNKKPDKIHYSNGLKVLAWDKKIINGI